MTQRHALPSERPPGSRTAMGSGGAAPEKKGVPTSALLLRVADR
jgi:hypothetical protein